MPEEKIKTFLCYSAFLATRVCFLFVICDLLVTFIVNDPAH
jgi:hypothetical protein